ncbi:unnamed protein product [Pleuronectes platessa]|uniref:Uncharacterized protein n=1 Tax=Pleuronectes platessa TaxID=8262 RepID=A0A9N7UFQ1_PLEPL|nr:unnamed protein product [Pleuronectes platessa]
MEKDQPDNRLTVERGTERDKQTGKLASQPKSPERPELTLAYFTFLVTLTPGTSRSTTVTELSRLEKARERSMWPATKWLSPPDEMDVSEFINGRKRTALSGGHTHRQTYARVVQISTVANLDVDRHLLASAGAGAGTASAKKRRAGFKFTSRLFLANAARS